MLMKTINILRDDPGQHPGSFHLRELLMSRIRLGIPAIKIFSTIPKEQRRLPLKTLCAKKIFRTPMSITSLFLIIQAILASKIRNSTLRRHAGAS